MGKGVGGRGTVWVEKGKGVMASFGGTFWKGERWGGCVGGL